MTAWPEDGRSFRGYQRCWSIYLPRKVHVHRSARAGTVVFRPDLKIDAVLAERWEHDFASAKASAAPALRAVVINLLAGVRSA